MVCGYFDVKPGEIASRDRTERVARARQIIWYLIKILLCTNKSEIARVAEKSFGAIHLGIIRVADLISVDRDFAQTISLLESRCRILLEAKE